MLRVNTKPRRRNAPRPAEKSAPQFRQWLRGRCCKVCGASENIEAAHVDHAGGKGVGTKVADRHSIPMCAICHKLQHQIGWPAFERKYGFDAVLCAATYWRLWPGRHAHERKLSEG